MHTVPTISDGDDVTVIGREVERSRLAAILDRALAGAGSLVLIGGPAGIGKTTLIDGAAHDAGERGMRIVGGACYDLTTTPPYGPWVELLRSYPEGSSELPPIPELLRTGDQQTTTASLDQFFRAFAEFMHDIAARVPLVMVLEDLHWADAASIELLRYLSRQARRQRIVILASYRDDELPKDHSLYTLLPLLARESRAERIDLQPFGWDVIRAYIANKCSLSTAEGDRLTDYLHRHSQGNPLFMVELLRALERDQILVVGDEAWRLGNLDELAPPLLIVQMIERQMVLLDEQAREALEVAAVLGEELQLDRWQQVAGLHDAALASAIDQGLAVRALEERGSDRLCFRHALIRDVLYHGMVFSRRRLAHRRVAELLLETGSPDPDAIADHFQRAGDERAVDWLILAGHRAAMSWAEVAAVERFEAALALLSDDNDRLRDCGWINIAIANNVRESDPQRANDAIEESRRIAVATGDRALGAYALWVLGQIRFFNGKNGIAEMVDGFAAMRRLSADELASRPEQLRLLDPDVLGSSVALAQTTVGRYPDAMAIAAEYLARDMPSTSILWNERGHAEAARAHALSAFGFPTESAQAFRQARDAYTKGTNYWFAAMNATPELLYIALRYQADDLEYRQRLAAETVALWARAGAIRPGLPARYGLLPLLVIEGQWAEARELATPFAGRDMVPQQFALIALGMIARYQGDAALAWKQVATGLPDGPETEPSARDLLFTRETHQLQYLAAELALDTVDLTLAARWIDACDRWLAWSGSTLGQADLQLLRARYAQIAGDEHQSRQYIEQAIQLATNPRQLLLLAAAHRLLAPLDVREQHHIAAEDHARVALQLAIRCGAPYEQALARITMAELGAATGRVDEAWAQIDEVRAICTPLSATPLLQRANAVGAKLSVRRTKPTYPAGLTSREVEVLRLVTTGLTDAEVAERLFVSPRTINTHLTSIYNKLGVTSRTAATRIAVEQGLTDPA